MQTSSVNDVKLLCKRDYQITWYPPVLVTLPLREGRTFQECNFGVDYRMSHARVNTLLHNNHVFLPVELRRISYRAQLQALTQRMDQYLVPA